VYDKFSELTLLNIMEEMKQKIAQYKVYFRAMEAWKLLKAGRPLDRFSHEDSAAMAAYDFRDPRLTNAFSDGIPSLLLVFDDCVGDRNVYRLDATNEVGRFGFRHRHFSTSIMFLVQTFGGHGGIPRQQRNNLSLCILFDNKSPEIKKQFAQDFCNKVNPEEFIALWDHACDEDHAFFMIDYDAPHKSLMYRRNFDTFISVNDFAYGDPQEALENVKDGYKRESDSSSSSSEEADRDPLYDSDEDKKTYNWKHDIRRGKQLYGQGTYGAGRKLTDRGVSLGKVFGGAARHVPTGALKRMPVEREVHVNGRPQLKFSRPSKRLPVNALNK
jgi:hypothetical protein